MTEIKDLDSLEASLIESRSAYLDSVKQEDTPLAQRAALSMSLGHILNFLRANGMDARALIPITSLQGALEDLGRKKKPLLFKTQPMDSKRPQSSSEPEMHMVVASVAVSLLMKPSNTSSKLSLEEAIRRVAPVLEKFPDVNSAYPRARTMDASLKSFRSGLEGHLKKSELKEFYESEMLRYSNEEPRMAAEDVIRILRQMST